jgi:hypothetical protein
MTKQLQLKHDWPKDFKGKLLGPRNLIVEGCLAVPNHLPSGILAYMEVEFREILWPAKRTGFARIGREFEWEQAGRVLFYRIIYIPAHEEDRH